MSIEPVKSELTIVSQCVFRVVIRENAPDDLYTRMQDPKVYEGLYGPMDEEQVWEHWAHNAIANGVQDVSRLDGWADVPEFAVSFYVDDVEIVP